ncbi:hypothetical protein RA276_28600, partial [Pseudomonas syringae pv. tagetis]|uniref:AMP-binding protein n=1 Tax=Pseudomonas syringae group genomosp. 7 TaxID=251699 RepID=UPI00376FB416
SPGGSDAPRSSPACAQCHLPAAVRASPPLLALDPAHWLALIEQHRISLWNSVTALFGMLLEHAESERRELPSSLRVSMLYGDLIALTLPERACALQPT